MPKQSRSQRATIGRVMHEYEHGELKIRGTGPKVKSRKQAIAIALHEAGATRQETPQQNRASLHKTKAKERRGATAEAETEGARAQDRTLARAAARGRDSAKDGKRRSDRRTKGDLYAEARRKDIPGRSKMTKSELARALGA